MTTVLPGTISKCKCDFEDYQFKFSIYFIYLYPGEVMIRDALCLSDCEVVCHLSTKIFQRVPRLVIGWWWFVVPVTRLETLFQVYQLSPSNLSAVTLQAVYAIAIQQYGGQCRSRWLLHLYGWPLDITGMPIRGLLKSWCAASQIPWYAPYRIWPGMSAMPSQILTGTQTFVPKQKFVPGAITTYCLWYSRIKEREK